MSNAISEAVSANLQTMASGLAQAAGSVQPYSTGTTYLDFKQEGDNGVWTYGKDNTPIEDGAQFVVNPAELQWGWLRWPEQGGKPDKLYTKTMHGPVPDAGGLPPGDGQIKEARLMQLVCVSGEDEGVQMEWETTAMGGKDAWDFVLAQIGDRINAGHIETCYPIVELSHGTPYRSHGKTIRKPWFKVVGWTDVNGAPESKKLEASEPPAPESEGTAAEDFAETPAPVPPRRRRRVKK